ncbi:MAG: sugar ABC transporter permease [Spirochaetaceae bacterium]|nr:sugar ABC transporter permease [Spirochaetaceae bacterium]
MRSIGIKKYTGLLYLAPWLIGLLVFRGYPFIASLVLSFFDYRLLGDARFVGFQNYINIFLRDSHFHMASRQTLLYVFMTVPLKLIFALFIAYILNFNLKGVRFYRTAYYIPSILGGNVAIAVLWRFLFADTGLMNAINANLGLGAINWFGDPSLALFTITLLRVWQFGSAMVIFLAALKNIPVSLYEAAAIDGASLVRRFISITLPTLTPVIFFNFIMQLIQAFQEFNGPFIITGGGPLRATYLYSLLIYDNAFRFFQMGYASALSWIMFVVVALFTAVVFRSSKYWVFYSN